MTPLKEKDHFVMVCEGVMHGKAFRHFKLLGECDLPMALIPRALLLVPEPSWPTRSCWDAKHLWPPAQALIYL